MVIPMPEMLAKIDKGGFIKGSFKICRFGKIS